MKEYHFDIIWTCYTTLCVLNVNIFKFDIKVKNHLVWNFCFLDKNNQGFVYLFFVFFLNLLNGNHLFIYFLYFLVVHHWITCVVLLYLLVLLGESLRKDQNNTWIGRENVHNVFFFNSKNDIIFSIIKANLLDTTKCYIKTLI